MPLFPVGEEHNLVGVRANNGSWAEVLITVTDTDGHYTLRTKNDPAGVASFLVTCPTRADIGGDIPSGLTPWLVDPGCTVDGAQALMQGG